MKTCHLTSSYLKPLATIAKRLTFIRHKICNENAEYVSLFLIFNDIIDVDFGINGSPVSLCDSVSLACINRIHETLTQCYPFIAGTRAAVTAQKGKAVSLLTKVN